MKRFIKQAEAALFSDILWSQPVNKRAAKKLLIVGGHSQRFSLVQDSYQSAVNAGIGEVKVALPKSIAKLTGKMPEGYFLPETPAGSLSRESLSELLSISRECDGTLLPGGLSGNSETVILLESFLNDNHRPIMAGEEVLESLLSTHQALLQPHIALVTGQTALSKLVKKLKVPVYINQPNLAKEIELLWELKQHTAQPIVLYNQERIIVSANGQISVTEVQMVEAAKVYATMAVWWLQQPDSFKALTTAAWRLKNS